MNRFIESISTGLRQNQQKQLCQLEYWKRRQRDHQRQNPLPEEASAPSGENQSPEVGPITRAAKARPVHGPALAPTRATPSDSRAATLFNATLFTIR